MTTRYDKIAIGISILSVLLSWLVTNFYFERMPHIEDEFAFVWQAQIMADGNLTIPSPEHEKNFFVPFVIDYEGQRFSKYPPGWSAALAVGIKAGLRDLVNPLLGGIAVWLIYALGKRLRDELTGVIAAALTATSPFFLMITGSLLSHTLTLVLVLVFVLVWFKTIIGDESSKRIWWLVAAGGVSLGAAALTRPFTAFAVAIPFMVHGIWLLIKGSKQTRLKLLLFGATAGLVSSLLLFWQYKLTGDLFTNLYTMWWDYDKVGFGVGYGVLAEGHSFKTAIMNAKLGLRTGAKDLFGWNNYSWIFLPFGIWAMRKAKPFWLVFSVSISLIGLHMAYWISSWLFGPRYYFEAIFALTITTAIGFSSLIGVNADQPKSKVSSNLKGYIRLGAATLMLLLVGYNLFFYAPNRLGEMRGLYDINRAQHSLFLSDEVAANSPSLIIVHSQKWMLYSSLTELSNPHLTSPLIFAWDRGGSGIQEVASSFPDRNVFHYYPQEHPDTLFEYEIR